MAPLFPFGWSATPAFPWEIMKTVEQKKRKTRTKKNDKKGTLSTFLEMYVKRLCAEKVKQRKESLEKSGKNHETLDLYRPKRKESVSTKSCNRNSFARKKLSSYIYLSHFVWKESMIIVMYWLLRKKVWWVLLCCSISKFIQQVKKQAFSRESLNKI